MPSHECSVLCRSSDSGAATDSASTASAGTPPSAAHRLPYPSPSSQETHARVARSVSAARLSSGSGSADEEADESSWDAGEDTASSSVGCGEDAGAGSGDAGGGAEVEAGSFYGSGIGQGRAAVGPEDPDGERRRVLTRLKMRTYFSLPLNVVSRVAGSLASKVRDCFYFFYFNIVFLLL